MQNIPVIHNINTIDFFCKIEKIEFKTENMGDMVDKCVFKLYLAVNE